MGSADHPVGKSTMGGIMAKEGKKPVGKIVLIVIVLLVVVGVAAGGAGSSNGTSSDSSSSSSEPTAVQQTEKKEEYTITDEAVDTSNQYMFTINGTLTNNSDSDKSYIQVSYNLYDSDGAQVGTALANTNNLKAGGTWKFSAVGTVDPSKVASWERTEVTGF